MKKVSIPACFILVLSLLLAVGCATFLGPCAHEDGSVGACFWAGRALTGIGAVLAVQAVMAMAVRSGRIRLGVYLSMLPAALFGLLTPGTLFSLCGMASMRCRAITQPAGMVLSGIIFVLACAGAVLDLKKIRKENP